MRMKSVLGVAAAALLTTVVAGAADASDIKVFKGRVELPAAGASPSAYFVLRNGTAETKIITGASCTCAESVSVRRTAVTEDGQWGSVGMPEGMPIPAGGDVAFVPRGLFLRLMNPTGLEAGGKVEIVLEFDDGEKVPFEAVVED